LVAAVDFTESKSEKSSDKSDRQDNLTLASVDAHSPTALLSELLRLSKQTPHIDALLRKRLYKTIITRIKNVIYKKRILKKAPRLRLQLRQRKVVKTLFKRLGSVRQYLRSLYSQRRVKKKFLRFMLSNHFVKSVGRIMSKPANKVRHSRIKSKQLATSIKQVKMRLKKHLKRSVRRDLKVELAEYRKSYTKTKTKLKHATALIDKLNHKFVEKRHFIKQNTNHLRLSKWFKNNTYVKSYLTTRLLKKNYDY